MEQTPNILPYFITGMVMMLIGWAMGFFDSNLRTSKKIKQAEDASAAAVNESKSRIAQVEARLAAIAAGTDHADSPGLLRVKNENGFLKLDLDGVPVDPTVMTAEQRKRLMEMLSLMRPWLEGKSVSIASPAPSSLPEDAMRSAFDEFPAPSPTQATSASSTLAASSPAILSKDDRPSAPAGSIVDQIDGILQTRLLGTPLGSRGIYLSQSLEGGVIVYVGTSTYMGVDEVPDPEVKAAIRGAIKEWEDKYTPGL
jgi:hypothetical protein